MKTDDFIALYSNKLNNILNSIEHQEKILKEPLKDGDLYIVNKEVYRQIILLSNEANDIDMKKRRKSIPKVASKNTRKSSDNFYYIAKILNRVSAYKYTIDTKEKYVTITTEEKIKERWSVKFIIWKNKQKLILEDTISEKKLYGTNKENLKNEFENNILIAKKRLDFILNNYDMFKSSLTSYKELKPYEVLYFTTEDKKTHQEHLRVNVPNILYFQKNDYLNSSKRSDKIVDKITSNGKHIFDDFYVEKKDEEFWKKLEEVNI